MSTVSRKHCSGVLTSWGVHWGAVGSLVAASLAIMGTPGPATISLTAAGSTYGVRRSLGYVAGVITGTWVVLLAVAGGITAALLAAPGIRPIVVAAGVASILWLAYHIATAPPLADSATAAAPGPAGGALLGVANPKAWVAIGAVFGSAQLASAAVPDAAAKVAVLTVTIVFINGVWLAAGASLAPLLRDARRARWINRALAVMLVAAGALAAKM